MGKTKPIVLLGAAVLLAVVITLLINSSIKKKMGAVTPPQETLPIATATVDLKWGTVVVKEMVKMEPFLKNSLPPGAFANMTPLLGRVVVSPIRTREPFLESRLAAQEIKTGGVAAVIGSGKRAVAVRVDKVIGVAGFVHPGNRVDVLVTMVTGRDNEPFTKIVLENIRVLAAGPEADTAKGKEQQPAAVDVITLEVTPEEAEKLGLSATQGKLQLALRGLSDAERAFTKGASVAALLAAYPGADAAVAAGRKRPGTASAGKPDRSAGNAFVVELIQAGKIVNRTFAEGR